MLHTHTIYEISTNENTGVEYEIALFSKLLTDTVEKEQVNDAINTRNDSIHIHKIINLIDLSQLNNELIRHHLLLQDVSFETQNDEVGPSDVVMYLTDLSNKNHVIGLSVKDANKCSFNISGSYFLSQTQMSDIAEKLPEYVNRYIDEMRRKYGMASNWFRNRKTCSVTDQFIDLIRDAVVSNWVSKSIEEKGKILEKLYHFDSPINFWVIEFYKKRNSISYHIETKPFQINLAKAGDVKITKSSSSSYVDFTLNGVWIGKMQIKFNNGILERGRNGNYNLVVDGLEMNYGKPLSSWNFCLVN